MPERIHQQRSQDRVAADDTVSETTGTTDRTERLRDDLDSLLDEIDDVLEENAEEFVKNYVQKGGE